MSAPPSESTPSGEGLRITERLGGFYDQVAGLTGWKRLTAAVVAGFTAALALPPYHFWPAGILAFSILIFLIDGVAASKDENKRWLSSAFQIGMSFGFGYFLVGLYWIGFAFLVDAAANAWMLPFAAALMPGGLALFTGGAVMVAARFWITGPARVLVFVVCWMVFEWLRGHILSGFPWNLVGYSVADSLTLIQSTSVFGIYGLSFLVLLGFCVGATVFPQRQGSFQSPIWLGVSVLIVMAAVAFGQWRLSANPPEVHPEVKVRIVQPSFPQAEKWLPENRERLFQTYLSLTQSPGFEDVSHVVWPESALPFVISRSPFHLQTIGQMLGEDRTLITGAVRFERQGGSEDVNFFNSVHVIDGGERSPEESETLITHTYDKHKLVPFGEFVPLADFFRALGLRPLVDRFDGYTAGPAKRTLPLTDAPPFGPLICYEVIFPGAVLDASNRPGWLVNVTNDAWYGDTAGPKQHLLMARVRAVENGLPLVRSANTGISTIIDPMGRMPERLRYGAVGVLDGPLPRALGATLYSLAGGTGFWMMMVFATGLAAFPRLRPA